MKIILSLENYSKAIKAVLIAICTVVHCNTLCVSACVDSLIRVSSVSMPSSRPEFKDV